MPTNQICSIWSKFGGLGILGNPSNSVVEAILKIKAQKAAAKKFQSHSVQAGVSAHKHYHWYYYYIYVMNTITLLIRPGKRKILLWKNLDIQFNILN